MGCTQRCCLNVALGANIIAMQMLSGVFTQAARRVLALTPTSQRVHSCLEHDIKRLAKQFVDIPVPQIIPGTDSARTHGLKGVKPTRRWIFQWFQGHGAQLGIVVELEVPRWSVIRHASCSASVCTIARGFG